MTRRRNLQAAVLGAAILTVPIALGGPASAAQAQSAGQQTKARKSVQLPAEFEALDVLMRTLTPAQAPGGAVEVMQDGRVLTSRHYGLADVTTNQPVQEQDVFRIASVTKPMTAALILGLVQDGRLTLDDELAIWLPDFPGGGQITLRHLLSHTSGVPDFTGAPSRPKGPTGSHSTSEMVDWIATLSDQPDFAPGQGWRYSNSGYLLLAAVIERVTGQTLDQAYRERVFAVDDLQRIAFETPATPGDVVGGHKSARGAPGFVPADPVDISLPSAAGAVRSDIHSLTQWTQALFDGRVIGHQAVEDMIAPAILSDGRLTRWGMPKEWREGLNADYGLGWFVDRSEGRRRVWHGGDIDGFSSFLIHYPDCRLTVAVLFNGENVERDRDQLENAVMADPSVRCPGNAAE